MTETESQIQSAICDYLAIKKYIFWRSNNIPPYDPKKKAFRRMPKYCVNGVSDIILLLDGKVWFLEVKRKNTKQSPNQKEFEAMVRRGGAEYAIVRSIEDIQKLNL